MLRCEGPGAIANRLVSLCWLSGGYQLVLPVADQVRATQLFQSAAQNRPVIRVVVAKKSLMQLALRQPLDRRDAGRRASNPLQRI